jgi:hypothetical protein
MDALDWLSTLSAAAEVRAVTNWAHRNATLYLFEWAAIKRLSVVQH